MENLELRIINNNEIVIESKELLNQIEYNNAFVENFLAKDELTDYKIISNGEEILFEHLFQLDVKIANVGTLSAYFVKNSFNKENAISEITPLKELASDTLEEKKIKFNKLIEILNKYNPLFAILNPNKVDSLYYTDLIQNLNQFIIFYVKYKEKKEKISINLDKKEFKFKPFFVMLWREKLFILFLFLASVILTYASYLAIYNCYANNAIYIFFFICLLAGTVLNVFIYEDIFKKYPIKSSMFCSAVVFNLIGYGAGTGIFFAYFNSLKTIPEGMATSGTIVLIGSIITILLLAVSIVCSFFLHKYLEKKKKAKITNQEQQ